MKKLYGVVRRHNAVSFYVLQGQQGESLSLLSYPTTLYPEGKVEISVEHSTSGDRKILVNLVDSVRQTWHGSARTRIGAGRGTVNLPLSVINALVPHAGYLLNAMLLPILGNPESSIRTDNRQSICHSANFYQGTDWIGNK